MSEYLFFITRACVRNKKPVEDDPDRTDYAYPLECKSCKRTTIWHRGTGIRCVCMHTQCLYPLMPITSRRFLLDDYRRNGILAQPHYHCSALFDLRQKYKDDSLINSVLSDACLSAKQDEWKVTRNCGRCNVCRHCSKDLHH